MAYSALDDDGHVKQLKLFPEGRAPATVDGQVVKIRMDKLAVRNMRNWGEVWLGMELWDKLDWERIREARANDLGLRPVYHQLEDRIEAHIFTAFMALCLLQTLRAIAREHAPGLTPRQIIEKFRTVRMVDVVMPTTDGRTVTLPRPNGINGSVVKTFDPNPSKRWGFHSNVESRVSAVKPKVEQLSAARSPPRHSACCAARRRPGRRRDICCAA